MRITMLTNMNDVDARAWNGLLGNSYPFMRHEFLNALEQHGAVGKDSGWTPCHLLAWQESELVGALPLYLKHHSWGEFVFDWAWAEAYQRSGKAYYPKLVAAAPYSPCTGPRLLVRTSTRQHVNICTHLIRASRDAAHEQGVSSLHCLFPDKEQADLFEQQGFYLRLGCQYHWENRHYSDFDDYLSRFTAEKRKKIKRERRRVQEAGVEMLTLHGGELGPREWQAFYAFYRGTFLQKSGFVPLNEGFFRAIGHALPEQVVMVLARYGGEYVAAALSLRDENTLYGRYWGASEHFHSLHFETCYYAGIDYCIRRGLSRFAPGAQGEHKISRGFAPTPTYSAHWLADPQFEKAVACYLREERRHMGYHMNELASHLPFKTGEHAAPGSADTRGGDEAALVGSE